MATKISRVTSVLFGSSAGPTQVGEFGSFANGTPTYSQNPSVIQSLSTWLSGWFSAVSGAYSPCIEDLNATHLVFSYMISYLCQTGIAEWDSGTNYYKGSLVTDTGGAGIIYASITDNNLNNALSSGTNWKALSNKTVRTVVASETASLSDSYLRLNGTGISLVETLPPVATSPIGFSLRLKNVSTDGSNVTVKGNASEVIDGSNTLVLASTPTKESVELVNNGTSWDIF